MQLEQQRKEAEAIEKIEREKRRKRAAEQGIVYKSDEEE